MNKQSFTLAFQDAVDVACRNAEKIVGKKLSRDVVVRLYGAGAQGLEMGAQEFIDRAYISDRLFYRLIDVMVMEVAGAVPIVFARISDHAPAEIARSWNGKNGPFKQLLPKSIVQKSAL
jgi:hypothetical protein